MSDDECRPVEVDGEVVRVRGAREMNDTDREMFAEVVRAAKRKLGEIGLCRCGHSEGHHGSDVCAALVDLGGVRCGCEQFVAASDTCVKPEPPQVTGDPATPRWRRVQEPVAYLAEFDYDGVRVELDNQTGRWRVLIPGVYEAVPLRETYEHLRDARVAAFAELGCEPPADEAQLYRLPYRGHYTAGGRITYTFRPEDLPAEVNHPRELIGSEIGVGEVRVRVVNVDHFAVICPRDGGRCGHNFGLVVELR